MKGVYRMKSVYRLWLLGALVAASLGAQIKKPEPDPSSLTFHERTVLEYLQGDWQKQYRTTSIGLAAQVTRIKLSDESRLKLAKFIEANRSSYAAPARHRTTTVALTAQEKLVARAILLLEAKGRPANRQDIASLMGVSARTLGAPLAYLLRFGVVSPEGAEANPLYRVDAKYPRRLTRFIDFFSHQVEVNGHDKFEVA